MVYVFEPRDMSCCFGLKVQECSNLVTYTLLLFWCCQGGEQCIHTQTPPEYLDDGEPVFVANSQINFRAVHTVVSLVRSKFEEQLANKGFSQVIILKFASMGFFSSPLD
jgi:hypothetical protein